MFYEPGSHHFNGKQEPPDNTDLGFIALLFFLLAIWLVAKYFGAI
jgi:hypothetical protein